MNSQVVKMADEVSSDLTEYCSKENNHGQWERVPR